MEFDKVKTTIIKLLENNGIIIESGEEDLDLRNYSIDSILFISFIIDVENEFARFRRWDHQISIRAIRRGKNRIRLYAV